MKHNMPVYWKIYIHSGEEDLCLSGTFIEADLHQISPTRGPFLH